jgi:hypothetical protein
VPDAAGRGRRLGLTREKVTGAALELIDREGRIDEITATGDLLLVNAAPHLAVSDHEAEFRYCLELLIAGLKARIDGRITPKGGLCPVNLIQAVSGSRRYRRAVADVNM